MGFIFLSMEDETGIANVIVAPGLYERERPPCPPHHIGCFYRIWMSALACTH